MRAASLLAGVLLLLGQSNASSAHLDSGSLTEIQRGDLFPAPKNPEVLRAFDELRDVVEDALNSHQGSTPHDFPTDLAAFTVELQDPTIRASIIGILPGGEGLATNIHAAIAAYRLAPGSLAPFVSLSKRLRAAREEAFHSVDLRTSWLEERLNLEAAAPSTAAEIEVLEEHSKMLDALSLFFDFNPRLRDRARKFRRQLLRTKKGRNAAAIVGADLPGDQAPKSIVSATAADESGRPAFAHLEPAKSVEIGLAESTVIATHFHQWESAFAGSLDSLEKQYPPREAMSAYVEVVRRATRAMLDSLDEGIAAHPEDARLERTSKRILTMLSRMEEKAALDSSSRADFRERTALSRNAVREIMQSARSAETIEQGVGGLYARTFSREEAASRKDSPDAPGASTPIEAAEAWKQVEDWRIAFLGAMEHGAVMTPEGGLAIFASALESATEGRLEGLRSTRESDPRYFVNQTAAAIIDLLNQLYGTALEASTSISDFFSKLKDPIGRIERDVAVSKDLDDLETRIFTIVDFFATGWERSADAQFDARQAAPTADAARVYSLEPAKGDSEVRSAFLVVDHWQRFRERLLESQAENGSIASNAWPQAYASTVDEALRLTIPPGATAPAHVQTAWRIIQMLADVQRRLARSSGSEQEVEGYNAEFRVFYHKLFLQTTDSLEALETEVRRSIDDALSDTHPRSADASREEDGGSIDESGEWHDWEPQEGEEEEIGEEPGYRIHTTSHRPEIVAIADLANRWQEDSLNRLNDLILKGAVFDTDLNEAYARQFWQALKDFEKNPEVDRGQIEALEILARMRERAALSSRDIQEMDALEKKHRSRVLEAFDMSSSVEELQLRLSSIAADFQRRTTH